MLALSTGGPIELEDLLGDVFSSAPLESIALGRFELHGPWGMRFEAADVAGVHVVVSGSCVFRPSPQRTVELSAGDVVMVPRGSSHALCRDRDVAPLPFAEISTFAQPGLRGTWQYGDGPRATELVCGVYRFGAEADHPILALLPKHIVSRASERSESSSIPALCGLLARELSGYKPGARTMVSRTLDMLFVEVLRQWASTQPSGEIGWLGALKDVRIASAIIALHKSPGHDWTLSELSQRAAMSEASLKRNFTALVGEPPLTYLARLRIDSAARLLRTTSLPIAEIASRVGYQNEFSFGRAFKRWRRVAPGRFRASAQGTALAH